MALGVLGGVYDDRGGSLHIREDDLTGEAVAGLLREHLEEMRRITPPESAHALDLEGLRRRGYEHLHLETAALPAFAPARALYRKYGFEVRGPFGEYEDDPNTVFMTKRLGGTPGCGRRRD